MKYGRITLLAVAAGVLAAAVPAAAQGQTRQAGTRPGHGVGTTVAASLAGIGDADGWGRIAVTDMSDGDLLQRSVNACLHGLVPETTYTVSIDGVELGAVTTDPDGEGCLVLRSDHQWLPPVPADLPPADMLLAALVVDPSLAPTLAGEFLPLAHGTPGMGGLVYQERVRLASPSDRWPCGTARVARDIEDEQVFDTRASGLTPELAYSVRIDGVEAGIVTPDATGQAQLVLTTEDGSLPLSLQPIEDLRVVEWVRNGDVVLSGAFSGDGTVGGQGPADDPPGNGGNDDGGMGDPGDGGGDPGDPGDGGHGSGDDGGNGGGGCDGGGGGRP